MGRPPKDGADYFPKNVDFYNDDKIRILKLEFGARGMYMLDYILCEIYGKDGYFMKWDKNKCFLVSEGAGCGCTPGFVSEFIKGCIRCSFFDKSVYDAFGVLTSHGIQKRFMRMLRNRTTVKMIEEYWLLDINDEDEVPASALKKLVFRSINSADNPILSTENPVLSAEKCTKEKKRKEKKYYRNNLSTKNPRKKPEDCNAEFYEYFDDWKNYKVPDSGKMRGDEK